ncbi:hypothetical protein H0H93_007141, partial [Arthromyces matolae]
MESCKITHMERLTRHFKKPRLSGPNDGTTQATNSSNAFTGAGIDGATAQVIPTGEGGTPAEGLEISMGGSQGGKVSRVLDVAGAVMGAINAAAPAFPPLQSVAGGLHYFIKNHQAYKSNTSDIKKLLVRLDNLERNFLKGPNRIHDDFVSKFQVMAHRLQELKSRAERYLSATAIAVELTGVVREIGEIVLDYQVIISVAHFEILLINYRLPSNKLSMTTSDSR